MESKNGQFGWKAAPKSKLLDAYAYLHQNMDINSDYVMMLAPLAFRHFKTDDRYYPLPDLRDPKTVDKAMMAVSRFSNPEVIYNIPGNGVLMFMPDKEAREFRGVSSWKICGVRLNVLLSPDLWTGGAPWKGKFKASTIKGMGSSGIPCQAAQRMAFTGAQMAEPFQLLLEYGTASNLGRGLSSGIGMSTSWAPKHMAAVGPVRLFGPVSAVRAAAGSTREVLDGFPDRNKKESRYKRALEAAICARAYVYGTLITMATLENDLTKAGRESRKRLLRSIVEDRKMLDTLLGGSAVCSDDFGTRKHTNLANVNLRYAEEDGTVAASIVQDVYCNREGFYEKNLLPAPAFAAVKQKPMAKKTTKKKAAKKTAAKKASPQPRKAPAKRAKKVSKASPITISTPSSRAARDIPARTRKAVEAWKASKRKHRKVVMFEDLYDVLGTRDEHDVYFDAMNPGDQKLYVIAEKMDKDGVTGELVGLVAEQGDEAHEYLYAKTLGDIHSLDRYNWLKANRRDGKLALEYLDKNVYGGRPNARNYLSWAFEESKKRAERPKRYLDWVDSSDLYLIRLPGEVVTRPSDQAAINRLTRGIAAMIRVPRGIQIRERNGKAEIILQKPAMFYNELRSWFGPGSTKTITAPLTAQGIRIALEDLDTVMSRVHAVMSDVIEAHAAAQASKPSKGTKKKSKKQRADLDVDAAGYKARKMSDGNRKKLVRTAIVSTLAGLRAGDKIKVTSKKYGDRKVTVVEPLETLEDLRRVARELGLDAPTARSARSAYVTSGKVRPGSRAGGSITWRPRNWDPSTKADLEEEVVFQPTMQQSISDVTAIELLERPGSFDPILETIEDIKVTRGKARKKTAKKSKKDRGIVSTLAKLREGDQVKVTTKQYGDQTVTVRRPLETLEDLKRVARDQGLPQPTRTSPRNVYVTSGGALGRKNGNITWRPEVLDPPIPEAVTFQPAAMQSAADITAIEVLSRQGGEVAPPPKARKKTAKPAAGSIFAGIDGEVIE